MQNEKSKVITSNDALTCIEKTKNNIKQLCSIVNSLDIAQGGTGRKVREEDFLENIDTIQSFVENRK